MTEDNSPHRASQRTKGHSISSPKINRPESQGDASCGMQRVWVQRLKEWPLIKVEAAFALRFNTPRYQQQRRKLWID